MTDKRLLVISNECFSQTGSNGRTLMNLLAGFAPERVAQFYLHGNPDFGACKNYYCVSDRDALYAVKHFGRCRKDGHVKEEDASSVAPVVASSAKKMKKDCRNRYLRHLVWRTQFWWNAAFDRFLDGFRPEVVLLQAGDAPFMYDIARKIAKKYGARLMMFNTENYVLKRVMYSGAKRYSPFHMLLKGALTRAYSRFMKQADFCFYSTEYLEESYQKRYPHSGKSTTLYVTSAFEDCTGILPETEHFSVVYCGNLGVGRADALDSFAKVLALVDPAARLDVYGKFASEEDEKKLTAPENVNYHGFVAYENIPAILSAAHMVLHAESSARVENLKGAFSTKIADCLACGRPFLVYASREYPFVQYLEKNGAAHIASTEEELAHTLSACIASREERSLHVAAARALADERHNLIKNAEKMQAVINGLTNKDA